MSNTQNRMAEVGRLNLSSIQGDMSSGNGKSSQNDVGSMDDYQFYASLDALLDAENLGGEDTAASNSSQQYEGMATTGSQPSQGLFAHPGMDMNTNENRTSCDPGYAAQLASVQPYTVTDNAIGASSRGLSPYAAPSSEVASYPQGMMLPMSLAHQPPQQTVVPSPTSSAGIQEPATGNGKRGAPTSTKTSQKRLRQDHVEVSEDEEDNKGGTRRAGRNFREQQRSQKITHQIDELRDLLATANIPFKADKYSTLVTVSDFIKTLQEKSAMLDAEHKNLIETISKTNEIVNNQHVPASSTGGHSPGGMEINADSPDQALSSGESEELALVRNIDYQSIFSSCGVPLAVASIDGRFMDCNTEFEKFTGYFREELLPHHNAGVVGPDNAISSSSALPVEEASVARNKHSTASRKNLSLFNLLNKEDMEGVFVAMSVMLKVDQAPGKDFWTGIVRLGRSPDTNVSDQLTY
jgi:PAS domain-containing protein